jgi:hypothetical protein
LISKSTPMPHKNIKRTTVKPLGLGDYNLDKATPIG